MKTKFKYAWGVDLWRGKGNKDIVLGTFTSKARALEAIDYWAPDGEYEPLDLATQMPMNGLPCIVNIKRKGKTRHSMLFVHRLVLDNGAAMARIKYEK